MVANEVSESLHHRHIVIYSAAISLDCCYWHGQEFTCISRLDEFVSCFVRCKVLHMILRLTTSSSAHNIELSVSFAGK